MNTLPIYNVKDELVCALQGSGRVIIEAPTGSGKSTQVPQMLLDMDLAGNGRIVVLQPRRMAARMLARRVARERSVKLGEEVGYQVRFDNCSGVNTRIKYETDGIILRELQGDSLLRDISVIVFDEFHERHLYSDIMLGLARELQLEKRPDLKLVVMSATLETESLVKYFSGCPVVRTEGRSFPVDIQYIKPNAKVAKMPIWDIAVRELSVVLQAQSDGDILVFMPGAYEIRRTIETIRRNYSTREFMVVPLYGGLSPEDQDRAVAPAQQRKIIVTTNIAETSLTIDGVCAVIDSGLVRRASFDPHRGINTLLIEKCSQASSTQRAGRAGRTAPGFCLRLWNERDHKKRDKQELPELLRVDLAGTILQMKHILEKGCFEFDDVNDFPWVTSPPKDSMGNAIDLLKALGALDVGGNLTDIGERMAAFPLHPRISRMLIAAEYYGCVPTVCLVAALLQDRGIMLRKPAEKIRDKQLELCRNREDSDLYMMINAWEEAEHYRFRRDACDAIGVHSAAAKSADVLKKQLEKTAESMGLDCYETSPPPESIYKSFLIGFSDHVGMRVGSDRCRLVGGRRGSIERDTVISKNHKLFVAAEINEIGGRVGDVDVRVSVLSAIKEEWLEQIFSSEYGEKRRVFFDKLGRCMRAEKQTYFRDLVIASKRTGDVTDDESATAMAIEVCAGNIKIKRWDKKVEQWINRINLVAEYCPEMGISKIDDSDRRALIEQICHGAHSVKAVKNREVWPVLRQWLSSSQEATVKAYAPERIRIGNGREPRLHYEDLSGPYIAMRVQELYDTHKNPAICNGKLQIKFHILAPSQRLVQVTDDIESFWRNSYEQVKKDLRARYPKHEWR